MKLEWHLVGPIAWGILLVGLLLLSRRLFPLLPIRRARREALRTAAAVLALLVGLVYAVYVARELFGDYGRYFPLALLGLLGALLLAGGTALRDVVHGALLRVGQALRVGDRIEVAGHRGRVEALGLRTLTLLGAKGERAVIPYGHISSQPIVRLPAQQSAVRRSFSLHAPETLDRVVLRRRIREAALLSHWASPGRPPEIHLGEGGEVEVTVYTLDVDRAPQIEAAVRRAVEEMAPPPPAE